MSTEQYVSAYSEAIISFYDWQLKEFNIIYENGWLDEISTSNNPFLQIILTSYSQQSQSLMMASEQAETCYSFDIIVNKYQLCLTSLPTLYVTHTTGMPQLKIKCSLTLSLLMSYIYGAPSKARNVNVVYIHMDLLLATLKQSLSICCTMFQH